jgi:succinoglycan biosynthesis protein ExoA
MTSLDEDSAEMLHQCDSAASRDNGQCGDGTPFVSILVPVRNEARFILHTLAQLVTQDYDPMRFEVLVIDGESTDDTPDIVAEFARKWGNVSLHSNPRRWSSAARNVGLRHARGEIIVIVDGHCDLPDNRYVTRLAAAFERSGADCIGRPQPLEVSEATALQRAIAAARSSWLGHHPSSYVYADREGEVPAKSVAAAYRRRVFEKVGDFDETFDACEDVEFNHRVDAAHLRCFLTPDATVRYVPRASLSGLFRQLVRYGRGRIRLLRKHSGEYSLGTFAPALFVAGLVLGLPLSLVVPPLAVAYAAAIAVYLALVTAFSVALGVASGSLRVFGWLPLVLVTIHLSSGAGLLWELLARPTRFAQPDTR